VKIGGIAAFLLPLGRKNKTERIDLAETIAQFIWKVKGCFIRRACIALLPAIVRWLQSLRTLGRRKQVNRLSDPTCFEFGGNVFCFLSGIGLSQKLKRTPTIMLYADELG